MQKKRGISLIVLVITIIVMIILAAAIILSLNNAGIIGNANKAVDESNMDTIKAEADLKYAEYLINKNVIGTNPAIEAWLNEEIQHEGYVIRVIDNETVVLKENSIANAYLEGIIKKGDYVTYKAGNNTETVNQYILEGTTVKPSTTNITVSDSLNWRVLGIDSNGELLLTLDNTTTEKISLAGKEGYFNGEQILHDACSVFGKGEHATGARSIIREDIDKITNVDYSNLFLEAGLHEMTALYIKYGIKVTIGSEKDEYVNWNEKDMKLKDKVFHLGTSVKDEPTNSTYTFVNNITDYEIDTTMDTNVLKTTDNAYKMLFINSDNNSKLEYCIASKLIGLYIYGDEDNELDYGMNCIINRNSKTYMSFADFCYGYNDMLRNSIYRTGLKPVVSIDKNTGFVEVPEGSWINNVATWDLK